MKRRTTLLAVATLATGALLWRRTQTSSSAPEASGVLGPEAVRSLYDRIAPAYDALATGYALVGGGAIRRRVVESLRLNPGDSVVDLCCGTGANFDALVRAVGPTGHVLGIDLSPGMLAQAQHRIDASGWSNVEVQEADVREVVYPTPVHGVLSTFGLEMVPEHDVVIARAVDALVSGGRIAVCGLRHPERWPEWLIALGARMNRPFGVSRDYEDIQPWRAVEAHASGYRYDEWLLGAAYLAAGEAT